MRQLIENLESDLKAANAEREQDGLPSLDKFSIRLLGQIALVVHPSVGDALHLTQTADLDALLEGDWTARTFLKKRLAEHGLVYDELSEEIWIPPGATFTMLHDSRRLKVDVMDPIYTLVSKAVKAPGKNKFLIQEALAHYGSELLDYILRHGGNPNFFIEE